MLSRRVLVLFALLLAAACDTTEEQRDFEVQAFLPPNGLGNDDWQIAPLFATAAFFLEEPTPNPVPAGELVALTLRVQEPVAFAGGLTLETSYDIDGNGRLDLGETAIPVDFTEYAGELQLFAQFDASRSDPSRGGRAFVFPRGAEYRLRLLNQRREVVSYGDIRLQD